MHLDSAEPLHEKRTMRIQSSSSKPLSPRMKFFFKRIFPLLFILTGVSITLFGVRGLLRAQASMDWPSTQGSIVESSVERERSSGTGNSGGISYHARIFYEYRVEGTTFNGDRVSYGDSGSSDPSPARRIVNRYPKGKDVTVYYMPEDPEVCVLEPGVKTQAYFVPGFGLIFLVAGILMAIYLPRSIRKQEIKEQANEADASNNSASEPDRE